MMAWLLFMAFPAGLQAQRGGVSYPELDARNVAPGLYLDHHVIPAGEGRENVWMNFRFGYDVLQFRRISSSNRPENAPEDAGFTATAELQVQIYKVDDSFDPERLDARQPYETLNWSGRAYAETFEETQKATRFLDGYASFLADEPGRYAYRVRVSTDGTNRPLRRNLRRFIVPDFNTPAEQPAETVEENGNPYPAYFLNASATNVQESRFQLSNYGRSVMYAQDFDVLMHLPPAGEASEYRLVVERLGVEKKQVFEHQLSSGEILTAGQMRIQPGENEQLFIRLENAASDEEAAFRLFHLQIPNTQFRNSRFALKLMRGDELISRREFRNLWIDIPSSLLNIDVALSMMRIIVDDETYDRLRSGNEAERIRKFYAFWEERDPEPEREYNPLMVEFYTRVDEAFDRFSSLEIPGYETDQGKTYIRFGSPQDIERRLPSDGPAREIWTYENREFVFEATSGFGEYELIDRRAR
ncbi:MAG: GWxTD domain-containing protein [Cyclonatronaceae bacterium]